MISAAVYTQITDVELEKRVVEYIDKNESLRVLNLAGNDICLHGSSWEVCACRESPSLSIRTRAVYQN